MSSLTSIYLLALVLTFSACGSVNGLVGARKSVQAPVALNGSGDATASQSGTDSKSAANKNSQCPVTSSNSTIDAKDDDKIEDDKDKTDDDKVDDKKDKTGDDKIDDKDDDKEEHKDCDDDSNDD